MRPKIYQGNVVLLTTLGKFKVFVAFFLILQNLLMMYLWGHCDLAADMVWVCYTRSRSVKSWGSSNIVLFWLHFFPNLPTLMRKIDFFLPFAMGPFLALFGPFITSFPHWILQKYLEQNHFSMWLSSHAAIPTVSTKWRYDGMM